MTQRFSSLLLTKATFDWGLLEAPDPWPHLKNSYGHPDSSQSVWTNALLEVVLIATLSPAQGLSFFYTPLPPVKSQE